MVKRVGAHPKPGLAKHVLALLLVPLVVALQRDHNVRAHVHAGSVSPEGHLRQLIEHRQGHSTPPSIDAAHILSCPCSNRPSSELLLKTLSASSNGLQGVTPKHALVHMALAAAALP